jgi:hypothetical protein
MIYLSPHKHNTMKQLSKGPGVAIAFVLLLAGCGPSQRVTSSWRNPANDPAKRYTKVFVAALVSRQNVRVSLENHMASAVRSQGYQVVKSVDAFAPTFTQSSAPDKDAMIGKIREMGCDLIFTVSLVDKQSETRYVPGNTMYAPYAGYGMGFRGYYGYMSPYAWDPGYYTTDKTYFMEGNLFDATTEALLWSVQTESYNPDNIDKFSEGLTQVMLERAQKDLKVK